MAAQAGLCLALYETPEDTFCRVLAQEDPFLKIAMLVLNAHCP